MGNKANKRNSNRIGRRIKEARESEGYTQKALADRLGLEYYNMISQIELGYVALPVVLWLPMANTLKLEQYEWLVDCLYEYNPEIYKALFGIRAIREVSEALEEMSKGKI